MKKEIRPALGARVLADWDSAQGENMQGTITGIRNCGDYWEVLVEWDFIAHVGGYPSWEVWMRRIDNRRVVGI